MEKTTTTTAPIWQTRPCPPWCIGGHNDMDSVGARECASAYSIVSLTTEETLFTRVGPHGPEAQLDTVHLSLEQGDREFAPRVVVARGDGTVFGMTLEEAGEFAAHITRLLGEAGQVQS